MAEKSFDPHDPMELVAVALPEGELEGMAECLVEEFMRDGWDDEALLCLFRDPFYRATHRIYQEKGEDYVMALIAKLRRKWGYWKGDDIALRLRVDAIKKQVIQSGHPDHPQPIDGKEMKTNG